MSNWLPKAEKLFELIEMERFDVHAGDSCQLISFANKGKHARAALLKAGLVRKLLAGDWDSKGIAQRYDEGSGEYKQISHNDIVGALKRLFESHGDIRMAINAEGHYLLNAMEKAEMLKMLFAQRAKWLRERYAKLPSRG